MIKTGRKRNWFAWVFSVTGLLSLMWILVRVIPKQGVEMFLASCSLVVWLVALLGLSVTWRRFLRTDARVLRTYMWLVAALAFGAFAVAGLPAVRSWANDCSPGVLLNGSFEDVANPDGVGTNWVGYQRAPYPAITTWLVKTNLPAPGAGLQYQQIANTNSAGGGGVRQDITGCTIGATYEIAGWMRGNSISYSTCQVRVSPSASTDWSTATNLNPAQTYTGDTWVTFGGTVVAAGTNMTLWLDGHTSGSAQFKAECFDAVTVTCVGAPSPPPAPTANIATDVSTSSFTANWTSSSGATGYLLDVSTNDSFANYVTGFQNLDVGNAVSWNVAGLSEATPYYYRVRAYNGVGPSDDSDTISVTTLSSTAPPPAPTALAATGVTSNVFSANWSSSFGATGYRLDVSTNKLFSNFVGGYQDLDVGNVLAWDVTGLTWVPTNYYRVRAYNTNGTSENSATITVPMPTGPISSDPTKVFIWTGTSSDPTNKYWNVGANWVGGMAPAPLSSNVYVFQGDYHPVPDNWPYLTTNYGTSILIFSNTITASDLSIKMLAGWHNTMNFGSYVRQDSPKPMYWGCTGPVPVKTWWVTNAYFTNALGDASVGGQTEFQCTGGRLDLYGVLKDGAGAHSKLVKSGPYTLNLTGDYLLGDDPNTYSGGTIVNAGVIKLAKLPGIDAIPGDVTVNGTGSLSENVVGGEQIADTAIVTLNDAAYFDLASQPETIQTVQSASANTSITLNTNGILTVAPSSSATYSCGGAGESDFDGSISDYGNGSVVMNGTGIYGMLGMNAVSNLIINSGTLKVNGNSHAGNVIVSTGGTLLGRGTISGAVTVANGGTIGAGFSAGQMMLEAGLDLSAGGTDVWELAALKDDVTGVAGTDFDQIVLSGGNLALGTEATLDIQFTGSATAPDTSNPFWQTAHSWTVLSMGGGVNPGASNFGIMKNGNYGAGAFTTLVNGNGDVVLTYTPNSVPTAMPPRITAVTGAGTGSVTVFYTNTIAGTNYVLAYNTNLDTPNWFTAGNKTAAGASDSQTDNSATTDERYYRVYYAKP